MSGSGVVKSAIVSKASTNDLLKAMSDWAGDQDDFRRRKIEVNMYKNGIYSDVTPSSFGTVTYNPDWRCSSLAELGDGLLHVCSLTRRRPLLKHIPAPTRSGFKFMGWYSGTSRTANAGSRSDGQAATVRTLWAGMAGTPP